LGGLGWIFTNILRDTILGSFCHGERPHRRLDRLVPSADL